MRSAGNLHHKLLQHHATLSTAESCTGGLIAHTLTNIPGSSAWFKGGIIAYANEIKIRSLGISAALIKEHGAVSMPVAKAMAEGARRKFATTFSVTTTGIAGPTGATPRKPVGLVFIAVAGCGKITGKRYCFKGSRLAIKTQTANAALDLVEKFIK